MKSRAPILLILLAVLASCNDSNHQELFASKVHSDASLLESMESNRQWPSYRGYFASGYLDNTHLPDSFNIETAYNVEGELFIAETGKEYKLLKRIPLGEVSLVTPGISEGMLILRTASKLIAVSAI